MSKSKYTAVVWRPHLRFREIGPRNPHALTNLTIQTAKWLALLTKQLGDVGSIPARGIFTNFSDKIYKESLSVNLLFD